MNETSPDLRAILEAPDLASLGMKTDDLLKTWQNQALEASEGAVPAASLEPMIASSEQKRYHLYGVIHGVTGGEDKAYRSFIGDVISSLPHVVFENGLQHFYPNKKREVIADFSVLGGFGSMLLGLRVCVYFPQLIYWSVRELLGLVPEQKWPTGALYHGIDPELRRALDEQPALPTRLQVELEMSAWEKSPMLAVVRDPVLIVPRSLFIAGYLSAVQGETVHCVVGDRHTTEVHHFLISPEWHTHRLFLRGAQYQGQPWRFSVARITHLLLSAVGSSVIVFPASWLIASILTLWML
jgi:hypothetical protein